MFTRDDLIDAITRHLREGPPGPGGAAPAGRPSGFPAMLPKGRPFLTEYEIKRRLTPQAQELRIPPEAILSPLACDWLILKGIKVVREHPHARS